MRPLRASTPNKALKGLFNRSAHSAGPRKEEGGSHVNGHLGPSWGHFGVILGHLAAILGPSSGILGASWAILAETVFVYERSEGLAGLL